MRPLRRRVRDQHFAERGRHQRAMLIARLGLGDDDAALRCWLRLKIGDAPLDRQSISGVHGSQEARVVLKIAKRRTRDEIAKWRTDQGRGQDAVKYAAAEWRGARELLVDVKRIEVADQCCALSQVLRRD